MDILILTHFTVSECSFNCLLYKYMAIKKGKDWFLRTKDGKGIYYQFYRTP